MFKWKKEDAQREIVDQEAVYAEKTGYYCDLCGELIEEDESNRPVYYTGHNMRLRSAFEHVPNANQRMPVNTILPYIEVRSLTGSRTLDMCPKCSSEIMSKVAIHSNQILENLIQVSRYDILHAQEARDKDHDEISRLRQENANMHDVINAIAYRND